jgi:hypothetical protein
LRIAIRLLGVLAAVAALTVVSVERIHDRTPVPAATAVPAFCIAGPTPIPLLQVVSDIDRRELRAQQGRQQELERPQAKICAVLQRP